MNLPATWRRTIITSKHISMIRNYFTIAIRNINKHLGFSAINIAGLTLGLTACILIGLFVWDEKQYDRFIPEHDQVFRLYDERTTPEGTTHVTPTPPMFATTLKQDFPETEKTARILMTQLKELFETPGKQTYEENGIITETSFFQLFPLKLKFGSYNKALDNPTSIILSEELAERFFGNQNPVGKTISMNKQPFQVTAVLANQRAKFHLKINYALPIASTGIEAKRMESWNWQQFFTYVKLKKGTDVQLVQKKFQDFVKAKIHPRTKEAGFTILPYFQPLDKIHLYSADFKMDIAIRGNILYVKGLSAIAIFILVIACFNFINLATAKSLQRAKEVGVRKSIGANRKQLLFQFTSETMLLTLLSMIVSIGIVLLVLPALNHFTGKDIQFNLLSNPLLLILLLIAALVIGIFAGFYPALVLSGFKPISVLKTSISSGSKPGKVDWLRHALVVVQFGLSALLIVSAMVVYLQVRYLHNKDLGFNKEEIMFFPMQGDRMFKEYEAFKNELLSASGVSSVSIGYGFPGDIFAGDEIVVPRNGQRETHGATHLMADYDYLKTLNLRLVAGRDFSKSISTDKDAAFIINETAVRELGFGDPQKAIGQRLLWHTWDAKDPDSMKDGRVIGVVKDFNYKSLYDKMEVAVIQIYPRAYWKVAVKLKTANLKTAINQVEQAWNKFSPEYPIQYKFMDDNFQQMYVSEEKLLTLVWAFTAIAIFVGCLGLFGLATYAAQRRIKEIGIRKVLGASVNGLVFLLSKEFLRLVLIALLIASPIAWYFMNNWLQDFAYRINIRWWVFGAAAMVAIAIAMLTVSFQAIKAAIANPVKSLRSE
jgi:putative ABC transport system permease protein